MALLELTAADLRFFDSTMRAIVLEYMEEGWSGRVSAKGHAILHAPDGVTTASVARSAGRGRSERNARSALLRWRRDNKEKEQENEMTIINEPTIEEDALGDLEKQLGVEVYACPDCGKEFTSKQSVGPHRAKTHGYRSDKPKKVRIRNVAVEEPAAATPDAVESLLSLLSELEQLREENIKLKRQLSAVRSALDEQ